MTTYLCILLLFVSLHKLQYKIRPKCSLMHNTLYIYSNSIYNILLCDFNKLTYCDDFKQQLLNTLQMYLIN